MSAAEYAKAKDEARQKLESGEFILKKKNGSQISSAAWSKFGEVYDKANNIYAGFVQCFGCGLIKIFQRGASPKWLAKHECSSNESDKHTDRGSFKSQFKDACIDLVAGDLRPFSTFAGPYFKNLVQVAVNAGAACGKFDASEIISDPTTISRNVAAKTDEARKKLVSTLKAKLEAGEVSTTTDLWTDSYTKRHYITLTVHFLNELWEMQNHVLFTKGFPDVGETAENILRCLKENVEAVGISPEQLTKITFVTDGGANIVKALSIGDIEREYCAAHCLNIVLKSTFAMKIVDADLLGDSGQHLVDLAHLSVLTAKRFEKNKTKNLKDKTFPKTDQSRHYHSSIPMLESLLENFSLVRSNYL